MKITFPLLLSLALSLSCQAGEKLEVLKLKDGTEYKKVEIMGVSGKGVRILHNSGAANVPVDQLPDALQKKYGEAQAKAAETEAAAALKKTESMPPPAAPAAVVPTGTVPPVPATPGKVAPAKAAPDAARLPQLVTGKIYGLAEVMADIHNLDGKIVRVEVIANTASRVESVGKGLYQIFVGDPSAKADSDYVFMSFPEEGRAKVETMLKGKRGKMTFYMEVRANDSPKIHAVGRSTSSGAPGTPIKINW